MPREKTNLRAASAPHPAAATANESADVSKLPVANFDPSSARAQPDWDKQAKALASSILPVIEASNLPNRPRAACRRMLDDAAQLYHQVEHEDARDLVLAKFKGSRDEDRSGCEAEMSLLAIQCVIVRLAQRDAEFPWLVDQCVRAFPTSTP